jgi:hypothetical protein
MAPQYMDKPDKFAIPEPSAALVSQAAALIAQIEEQALNSEEQTELLEELNCVLTSTVSLAEVLSYSGAEDTHSFVQRHLLPDPRQFSELSQLEIRWLVQEILNPAQDTRTLEYYSRILDCNFAVSDGTTVEIIFHSGAETIDQVIAALLDAKAKTIHL